MLSLKQSFLFGSRLDGFGTTTTIFRSRGILSCRNNGNKDLKGLKRRVMTVYSSLGQKFPAIVQILTSWPVSLLSRGKKQ